MPTITNPAGETTHLRLHHGGLARTSLTDPRGGVHSFDYDELGRLTRIRNPVGGFTALARSDDDAMATLSRLTNALGDTSTLMVEMLPTASSGV